MLAQEIEISIKKLAELIQNLTGHKGEIIWDKKKPDGTPRKFMDSSKLHQLGWSHKINLKEGILSVLKDHKKNLIF